MRGSWIRVCVLVVVLGSSGFAQLTQRVSLGSGGAEGNGPSSFSSISADGGFVAFVSAASNLVAGDSNVTTDVFVRDLLAGTTQRVNLSSLSAEGNGPSGESFGSETQVVGISADGRYVMFPSRATNLVPGDTNAQSDVFVRDRQTGQTERVSVDSSGTEANERSYSSGISTDGRYVVFVSLATNLVPGDTNGASDIMVRDRQNLTTERVSIDSGGVQGNGNSVFGSISADGRFVAFMSNASNLAPGDTNGVYDVFVRDRQGGTTARVSVSTSSAEGNAYSSFPMISANGRYVVFTSAASNLVAGDTNGVEDVFVRDRQTGTTERVSVDSAGAQSNGAASVISCPSISDDGRYVAFGSAATNLVPGDTNGAPDIFLRDRLSGTTERVSLGSDGTEGNNGSQDPTISADGRRLVFWSNSINLVQGDGNGTLDVFLRDEGAGGTDPESDGVGGVPSNGNSLDPALSPDGRFLAFESNATNIVAADTNGARDVFLIDRDTNMAARVSVDSAGAQADAASTHPAVSADGRYVAFESLATNLVPGDTNGTSDVFVRDLLLNTTTRVSVDSAGGQSNGDSHNPSISSDGRYVAFDSAASNLVGGDSNLVVDVFVRDRQTGTTMRSSVDSGGTQGLGGGSSNPSISADGRNVAFESAASNLVSGDTNGAMDVFVRDLVAGTTTRWSVDSVGGQANGDSSNAAISGDGGSVAFQSTATNLIPGDTNLVVDVFVRKGGTGTVRRASIASDGSQGLGGGSTDPSISVDGRNVGFASNATNLASGDTNGVSDVFVNDGTTGGTRRVSVDSDGAQGLGGSGGSAVSADGRFIAFDSFASNLVQGDTNGFQDVFLRDEGVASAFESFCAGDGSLANCPCNNNGSTGRGCQNSGGTGGALLTVTGVARLTADTVQFTSSGEKPTALSIFLQGTTAIAPASYGDGLRCTGGALKRLFVKSAVAGVAVAPQPGDLSVSSRSAFQNAPIPLGATREYQVYYRDSVLGFCPTPLGSTFNVSNGMIVAWGG